MCLSTSWIGALRESPAKDTYADSNLLSPGCIDSEVRTSRSRWATDEAVGRQRKFSARHLCAMLLNFIKGVLLSKRKGGTACLTLSATLLISSSSCTSFARALWGNFS